MSPCTDQPTIDLAPPGLDDPRIGTARNRFISTERSVSYRATHSGDMVPNPTRSELHLGPPGESFTAPVVGENPRGNHCAPQPVEP